MIGIHGELWDTLMTAWLSIRQTVTCWRVSSGAARFREDIPCIQLLAWLIKRSDTCGMGWSHTSKRFGHMTSLSDDINQCRAWVCLDPPKSIKQGPGCKLVYNPIELQFYQPMLWLDHPQWLKSSLFADQRMMVDRLIKCLVVSVVNYDMLWVFAN